MQFSRISKIRSVLAALLLLFSVFSLAFKVFESDHNCSGDNCAVCLLISVIDENLKLGGIISGFVFCHFSLFFAAFFYGAKSDSALLNESLISKKIRLNI